MTDADEELSFAFDPGSATLHVGGGIFSDLDAHRLERQVLEAAALVPQSLDLDLTEVTFLPSLGIQHLVGARRKVLARGRGLTVLVREGSLPHRVLRVTGIPATAVPAPDRRDHPASGRRSAPPPDEVPPAG